MKRHISRLIDEYLSYEVDRIIEDRDLSKKIILDDFAYYMVKAKRSPWVIRDITGDDILRYLRSENPVTGRKPTMRLWWIRAVIVKEFFNYLMWKGYAAMNPVLSNNNITKLKRRNSLLRPGSATDRNERDHKKGR